MHLNLTSHKYAVQSVDANAGRLQWLETDQIIWARPDMDPYEHRCSPPSEKSSANEREMETYLVLPGDSSRPAPYSFFCLQAAMACISCNSPEC
jgi:hypothetical protein